MQTDADQPMADWHVPRSAEARRMLDALVGGPVQGLRLFGPRRIGKTWFLLLDLAPMAEARGHRVLYCDFWRGAGRDPAQLLLAEVADAERPGYLAQKLGRLRRLELKILGTGGTLDVAAPDTGPGEPVADALARSLTALADPARPTILLLDEFQQVARAPGGTDFVAVLRAVLSRNPQGLRTIFTGSSQDGLNALFSARDAPFFRFASRAELPPLGEEFVRTQFGRLRNSGLVHVTLADAQAVFAHYGQSPMWFNRWIAKLMLYPSLRPEEARLAIEAEVAEENGFDRLLDGLTRPQRAMLLLLAEGGHGTTGRAAVARHVAWGFPAPSKSALDAAVQALARRDLIEKNASGRWQLRDTLLADWARRKGEALLAP
jgi:hypothetical protein